MVHLPISLPMSLHLDCAPHQIFKLVSNIDVLFAIRQLCWWRLPSDLFEVCLSYFTFHHEVFVQEDSWITFSLNTNCIGYSTFRIQFTKCLHWEVYGVSIICWDYITSTYFGHTRRINTYTPTEPFTCIFPILHLTHRFCCFIERPMTGYHAPISWIFSFKNAIRRLNTY